MSAEDNRNRSKMRECTQFNVLTQKEESARIATACSPAEGKLIAKTENPKMKKRSKITLRTKIYLTIVALLALTGIFYAANPTPFATVDGPEAWPLPRLICSRPNSAAKISIRSTARGMSRWRGLSRVLLPPWKNTWLSLQFSPRPPGSRRATFSSHKALTSLSSREVSSRRLRRSGAPSRTTARLRSTMRAHLSSR